MDMRASKRRKESVDVIVRSRLRIFHYSVYVRRGAIWARDAELLDSRHSFSFLLTGITAPANLSEV